MNLALARSARQALVLVAAVVAGAARAHAQATAPRDSLVADSVRARQRLEAVVVTGTRLTAPPERSNGRVEPLDLRRAPAGPDAVTDALLRLGTLNLFDDAGSRLQPEVQLRGFTLSPIVGAPQGVSVFVNGVRVNEADAQEVHFDLLPVAALEEAALVRGSNVQYGRNSLGGSLLFRTRRGDASGSSAVTLGVGQFGAQVATFTRGGMLGKVDYFVAASASNESGWRDATSANTRSLFATIGRQFGASHDSGDIALDVHIARDRLYQAGSLPQSYLDVSPRINYTGGDRFEPALFAATLRGNALVAGGTLRGTLWTRRLDYRQFNGNIPPPDTDGFISNRSVGATLEWSRSLWLGAWPASVTVGGELQRDQVDFRLLAVGGGAPDSVTTLAGVQQDNVAAYAQGTVSLTPTLHLTLGARADVVRVPYRDQLNPSNDGTNTFRRISPEIALEFEARDDLRLFASYRGGFRAPAPLELACASPTAPCSLPSALGADPTLEPVTTQAWEAGLALALAPRSHLDVTGFWTDVQDDIHIASPSLTQVYFLNVPRTRRVGIEASVRIGLPAGARLFATYGYLRSTFESTVQLATVDTQPQPTHPGAVLPTSPLHRARTGVGLTRSFGAHVLEAEADVRAVSSQFMRGDEANQRAELPGYAVVGLRAAVSRSRFRVSVQVDNLLDRSYASFGILARNVRGPQGATTPPVNPPVEPFLTPGYPRRASLSVGVVW